MFVDEEMEANLAMFAPLEYDIEEESQVNLTSQLSSLIPVKTGKHSFHTSVFSFTNFHRSWKRGKSINVSDSRSPRT